MEAYQTEAFPGGALGFKRIALNLLFRQILIILVQVDGSGNPQTL